MANIASISASANEFPPTCPTGSAGPVSVIIPAYNSTGTLEKTLPAILDQDRSLIAEIIVVDSSDDGRMEAFIRDYQGRGVRFIRSGTRVMPAIQRNIGARAATGKLLVFLDSDVIPEPGYIAQIVSFYNEGCKAGLGAVVVPEFQRHDRMIVAQYYTQLNEFLPAGATRRKAFVIGAANFCDREVFFQAGGYPELRASEDVLFGKKVAEITPLRFFPQARVAHIFRADRESYARNQRMLGAYVAYYRGATRFPLRVVPPRLLYPLFWATKFARMLARIIAAGGPHPRAFLRAAPDIAFGLHHWTLGFIEELEHPSERTNQGSVTP